MLHANRREISFVPLGLRRFHFALFEKQSALISISDRKAINLLHVYFCNAQARRWDLPFISER